VNPNRTKITRFVQLPKNWGPGTKAGKKEGRTWRGKRKREDDAEMEVDTENSIGNLNRRCPTPSSATEELILT
jgi:hypothetical protein